MELRNEDEAVRRRRDGAQDEVERTEEAEPIPRKAERERKSREDTAESSGGIGVLDILRVLGGLLLLNSALSWFVTSDSLLWGYRPWFTRPANVRAWWRGPVYLTDAELLQYDGSNPTKSIFLGLNGSIYDVTAGRHFYGPGGSYHFFAGRDAARAFLTGCFSTDLTPDLRGVEEMYVPLDPDPESPLHSGPAEIEDEDSGELRRKGGKKGVQKAELKMKREEEWREARRKVEDAIEGWAKTFRGESGRPYFWVGEIRREEGWLEKVPRRELCEDARKSRPKRRHNPDT